MRALVVDDSRIMRMMVRKQLNSCGLADVDIREAANGREALASIREHAPDLVLSDVNMPVMDGEQLLYEVADNGFLADGRVVMVTSRYERRLFGRLLGYGASAIIRKPFTTDSFRRRLEPILQEIVDARQGTATLSPFTPPHESPTEVNDFPVEHSIDDDPGVKAAKAAVQVLQTLGMHPALTAVEHVPEHIVAYAEVDVRVHPTATVTVYGDHAACSAISLATLGIPTDDVEQCAEILAELTNIVAGKWLSAMAPGGPISFGNPVSGTASASEVVLNGLEAVSVGDGVLLVGVVT